MKELPLPTVREISRAAGSLKEFTSFFTGIQLRPYQLEAAEAIIQSVFQRDGETFVVIFSRQSGKDELLANLLLFLMFRYMEWGADMVCAQPTFKPQTVNAMERLLRRGANFGSRLTRTAGYIVRLEQARLSYFSAEPAAHQVGATADRLLVINEAQDVLPVIYDKRFSPMAASGNATRVFSGTAWTSDTLLAREMRLALEKEKRDGRKRVFCVDADEVGRCNELYSQHVLEMITRHGRQHPFVRTQYYCEEVDAQAGMFNAARMALIFSSSDSPPRGVEPERGAQISPPRGGEPEGGPKPGHLHAFLLDVAGQDECAGLLLDTYTHAYDTYYQQPLFPLDGFGNPGRDSTTLSIVEVDLSTLPSLQAPTYRVVGRRAWRGLDHLTIFGQLKALAEDWKPQHIVIDATGVGEGLWSMLNRLYPTRTIPVKFSQQTKSEIGWKFLSIIETGRFRDVSGELASGEHCLPIEEVRMQYMKCQSEILPGPARTLRWGVKDGTRGPDGRLVHDDHVLADSLVAMLDELRWTAPTSPTFQENKDAYDTLKEMYEVF